MDITAPKHPPEHPHRGIDCEFTIEPTVQAIITAAVAAGWNEAEVAEAVLKLARNHIAGMLADQYMDMDMEIEAAARSVM